MKQGLPFEQLVERVEGEAARRRDYYVPTAEMEVTSDETGSHLTTPCGHFQLNDRAHIHLAEVCGVDRRYWQRMRAEAPHLLDRNANHWLTQSPSKPRIVRVLENERPAAPFDNAGTTVSTAFSPHEPATARAIVSSRYAILDNDALLRTVGPIVEEQGLTVESCDLGEDRLTLKMVSPRLKADVKVGDPVQVGIIVRNSEVRCSAVEVSWFLKRLVCLNGMVINERGARGAFRRHVGRDWNGAGSNGGYGRSDIDNSLTDSPPAYGLVPENVSRQEWENGVWQQFQSSLRDYLRVEAMEALLQRLTRTTTMWSGVAPEVIAQRLADTYRLSAGEQDSFLYHVTSDRDTTLWGVLNAVTRTAQDVESYARATSLEELGGILSQMSPQAWDRLVSPN